MWGPGSKRDSGSDLVLSRRPMTFASLRTRSGCRWPTGCAPVSLPPASPPTRRPRPSEALIPCWLVSKLSGGYGELKAIRGIDLSVNNGEVVALLGPNGAGKTTILRAILGFLHVTVGDIVFDGRSILGMAPERVARSGIALVPEGRRILGSLTVAEKPATRCGCPQIEGGDGG